MPKPRLLIVDDDFFITSFLEAILEAAGYAVTVAADGQIALDLLAADPAFDTVMLDRQMAVVGGMEVLQNMKRDARLKDIPVVIETGMDSADAIREGLQAGAFYYLVKPLDPRLVLQVVAAATGEYANRRQFWAELEATRAAMGRIRHGLFEFQTIQQCHDLTALLAKAAPDPKRTVTGLSELMINALEHGNLGISYQDKTELVEAGRWTAEVLRRQSLPENRDRWVQVSVRRFPHLTRYRIQDQGQGFPWQDFQAISLERVFDSHGRGILLAKWEAFDRVTYQGSGNLVVAEIDHR